MIATVRSPKVGGVYFVSRWREESPFSKRVVTVPDETVLDWFRRGWDRDDPEDWIDSELGGGAYGLNSIFDEARKQNLSQPRSLDQLRELLHEHLWVEADDPNDAIRLSQHALRVRTDDDEVDLAYYFIDDEAAAAAPDRVAYLLHDTWPLPTSAAAAGADFHHEVAVRAVLPPAPGPESVFSVRLAWESPDTDRNLDLARALALPGLTLPDLAAHLRGVDDANARGWPHDARLLRALVGPGDEDIGPAVKRYARLPGHNPSPAHPDPVAGHHTVLTLPPPGTAHSLVRLDTHIAQIARHIDDFFGYDQWFLFDTRWAAAHPDLARSLLRYAAHWDPYQG